MKVRWKRGAAPRFARSLRRARGYYGSNSDDASCVGTLLLFLLLILMSSGNRTPSRSSDHRQYHHSGMVFFDLSDRNHYCGICRCLRWYSNCSASMEETQANLSSNPDNADKYRKTCFTKYRPCTHKGTGARKTA
jgi:hypothetical protein